MMGGITVADVAETLQSGVSGGAGKLISAVTIDSRKVAEGSLFIALPGENVDGHDYVEAAHANGAAAAVVERLQQSDLPQIVVKDSAAALAAVGQLNRNAFDKPVIALTGSAGKTTCKNMLESILTQRFSVCSTEGNLNNELGVPLTLSRISEKHDIAVIEMGAAQQGDIEYLINMSTPKIAILTNVADAHIGRFGSLETTARTKGEIFSKLGKGDLAVVNADDSFASYWRDSINNVNPAIRMQEFSLDDDSAGIYATQIVSSSSGQQFTLNYRANNSVEAREVSMQLLGRHNVANALAASAAALDVGCSLDDIAQGLAKVQAATGRLQLRNGSNDLLVIDDSYNANPQAMQAAVDVSEEFDTALRFIVLGDIGELGEAAFEKHKEVGAYVAKSQQATGSLSGFFAIGEFADAYRQGYESQLGENASSVFREFSSKQQIVDELLDAKNRCSVILLKGSRFTAMDEIADAICLLDAGNE